MPKIADELEKLNANIEALAAALREYRRQVEEGHRPEAPPPKEARHG